MSKEENAAKAASAHAPKETTDPPATRVQDRAPDSEPLEQTAPRESKPAKKAKKNETSDSDATSLAEECLVGSWGTGRDRDLRLAAAGHDPDAVRKEVYRIRGERRTG